MADDILEIINNEDLLDLVNFYRKLGVKNFIYVHLYLLNQLKWNLKMEQMQESEKESISDRCKQKFYRMKNGKKENATIVGLTGEKDYCLFMFTLEDSQEELKKCLSTTKLINWKKCPLLTATHEKFLPLVYKIFELKKVKIKHNNFTSCIMMEKEAAKKYEIKVPEDVMVQNLRPEDAVLVDNEWPYKYPESDRFIESMIKMSGGLGIYLKEDGRLVSWILHIECFGLGLLQTIKEHQGKGYARLLTRALTRKLAEDYDEDVILFASHGKPETVDLYLRYDFERACFANWIYLKL